MNNTLSRKLINQEVTVSSLYFRPGRHLKGFPKRMEFEGREYTFIESGLRYLMHKGQQLIEVFDMTDGTNMFRLKFTPEDHQWTLVGMKENNYVVA